MPPPPDLRFDGIDNIRDLGGLHTVDGRVTRHGRVLRSSAVHEATQADAERVVRELGVRLLVDLRSPKEVERLGRGPLARRLPAYVHAPLLAAPLHEGGADTLIDASKSSMLEHYVAYLQHSAMQLAMAVRLLASDAHLPALFHCAAGKDRTGVLAALVLDAVGVRHDEIVADYVRSAANMPLILARLRQRADYERLMAKVPPYALQAPAQTMQDWLAHLQHMHGGAVGWLDRAGVGSDVVTALKRTLLDDAPAGST